MKLKKYDDLMIDFRCKWVTASGIFMGTGFFIRMFYYFAFPTLEQVGLGEMLFCLILPLLFWAGYTVLLNCLHWNAPGLYGILGAAIMVLMMVETILLGDILQILIAIPGYFLLGALLVLYAGGYLPDKVLAVVPLMIAVVLKIIGLSLDGGIVQALPNISSLAVLLGMLCLPMCMKKV